MLPHWRQSNKQPKEGTDIIYTDFQKAFDSVQHKRLSHKLSVYGIQGKLLNWIKSFLTNRRQRVLLNGSPSDWEAVVSGVPQAGADWTVGKSVIYRIKFTKKKKKKKMKKK